MYKLLIVDIQPVYSEFIDFNIEDFTSWLNDSNFDEVYCLYNGPELGYNDDEWSIKNWYTEWGLSDISINFFEKSYGWFRDFMEVLDNDNIINIGKYMIDNDIWDSRYISNDDIEILKNRQIDTNYLSTEDRVMYIPELKDYIENNIYNNDTIMVCGGGVSECLKETLLLLDMLEINYSEKIKFIY